LISPNNYLSSVFKELTDQFQLKSFLQQRYQTKCTEVDNMDIELLIFFRDYCKDVCQLSNDIESCNVSSLTTSTSTIVCSEMKDGSTELNNASSVDSKVIMISESTDLTAKINESSSITTEISTTDHSRGSSIRIPWSSFSVTPQQIKDEDINEKEWPHNDILINKLRQLEFHGRSKLTRRKEFISALLSSGYTPQMLSDVGIKRKQEVGIHFTEIQLQEMQQAWDPKGNGNEKIIEAFNIIITRSTLWKLNDAVTDPQVDHRIHDDIIDFYNNLLQENSINAYLFPCHLWPDIQNKNGSFQVHERALKLFKRYPDIWTKDKVIIPIHYPNLPEHWALGVLNVKVKQCQYLDSLAFDGTKALMV